VSNEEVQSGARLEVPETGANEIEMLMEDLAQGGVSAELRATADSRNPGCSGK
jgi:hypothetical protein